MTHAMYICPCNAVNATPHLDCDIPSCVAATGQQRMSRAHLQRRCTAPHVTGSLPEASPLLPCSEAVARAMRMCPRNAFVPQAHADQAFMDAPIRLDDLDFNISAPHMHATCLEALQLQPGQR